MVKVLTKHNISEVLERPQNYIDVDKCEDLICINDTTISLTRHGHAWNACSWDTYYFVVRYPDDNEIKIEYLNKSLKEAYKDILDKCIPERVSFDKKSSNEGSNIKFTIETLNDNGSGMKYTSKNEVLREISLMIDDCQRNGGTFMDFQIDSDVSCFYSE